MQLHLEGIAPHQLDALVRLGCGLEVTIPAELDEPAELLELAAHAQRFLLDDVAAALEAELAHRHLRIDTCARLLAAAGRGGLRAAAAAARALALGSFEAVAATDGFLALGEQDLADLLADDALHAPGGEEAVFRAAARWMRAGGAEVPGGNGAGGGVGRGGLRGEGLLGLVRFAVMDAEYLAGEEARGVLPEAEGVEELLQEACMVVHNPFQARPPGRPGRPPARPPARPRGARVGVCPSEPLAGVRFCVCPSASFCLCDSVSVRPPPSACDSLRLSVRLLLPATLCVCPSASFCLRLCVSVRPPPSTCDSASVRPPPSACDSLRLSVRLLLPATLCVCPSASFYL